ncbi:MAG: hypothetical protein ABI367_01845 [Mucilaginibacter sp.]
MQKRHTFSADYSVITFATNKQSYVQFAFNCTRSILLHNDISIFIVSNLNFTIPEALKNNVFIVPARQEHVALGIGMKLHIDKYLQTPYSLFIDSDCMVYGSLAPVFEAAGNNDITVAGNITAAQNWCGNEQAETIKQHFGLTELIRYNGGLYYLKKSAHTTRMFDKARAIGEKYDEYGFSRINNKWINEEAPISIAITLNHQHPMPDNGQFMTDLFTNSRPDTLNVLTGAIQLKNPPLPSGKHRPWYPVAYSPIILHFGGSSINSYPYNSQIALLKLNDMGLPLWLSSFIVTLFIHVPYKMWYWFRRA